MKWPWQKKAKKGLMAPPETPIETQEQKEEEARKAYKMLHPNERPRVLFYPGKVVEIEGMKFRVTEAKANGRLFLKTIR